MTIRIIEFDPHTASDELWAAFNETRRVIAHEFWPDEPILDDAETRREVQTTNPMVEFRRWVAMEGDEVAGSIRAAFRRPGIFFGFLRVATDDIAPPGDRRLADRQFGLAFLAGDEERHGEAVILDDLSTHLATGALAHAEDVFDFLGFEGGDGVGADHAAIGA